MASDKILWFEELSSTNKTAWEYIDKQSGFCVATGFQSSGRGQSGNSWTSEPNKNLLASYIFTLDIKPAECFAISMITSLAVVNLLNSYSCAAKIKWPNDIIVDNKKIAGILIENIVSGDKIEKSIIGIGLNLNQIEFAGLPSATSLKLELRNDFDIKTIASELQRYLISGFENNKEPSQELKKSYFELLFRKDKAIYRDNNSSFEGKIIDIDFDGALKIQKSDNCIKSYYFKEVQMLY
ncbi:MAG TPA: biotin--[acetyl-CoA-carboxylase] ligase [Salinivirgaceae bacterium]|nr:biotin--[acetyl-CoA-carboxylase] ligase [Salinivirgaceae bacterium]HQA76002.1 biotin--[acetyl-CoA-carboxylase] ligase [Salinivirgaceae bacterium]